MKKFLVTAVLFGAFANAQEVTPTAAPSSHSLFYAVDADSRIDGDYYEAEHFLKYTYKFANGYKLAPGLSWITSKTKDSATNKWGDIQNKHEFLRVELDTPKFWDIAGFKTNVKWRYVLPTAVGDDSYGVLSNRLIMEQEFNSSFNLTLIPKLNLYFQRNGHNAAGEGNKIVGLGLDVQPQYVIMENLTATLLLSVGGNYVAEGRDGSKDAYYSGVFEDELEIMYTVKSLGDLGVGVFVADEGNTFDKKFELFQDNHVSAGLRVQKALDL